MFDENHRLTLVLCSRIAVLADSDCLRAFCRLLSNMKCTYQLSDFLELPVYKQWITSIANFNILIFNSSQQIEGAAPLLLHFWAGITKALRFTAAKVGARPMDDEHAMVTEVWAHSLWDGLGHCDELER